jgi:hypothetical protein
MNGSGQTPNAWRIAPDEIWQSCTPKGRTGGFNLEQKIPGSVPSSLSAKWLWIHYRNIYSG